MNGPNGSSLLSRRHALAGATALMLAPLPACSIFSPPPPVVGYLDPLAPDIPASAANLAAFRQGLAEQGFIEDQSVAIEYRYAGGQADRLPTLAKELVDLNVAVLAVNTVGAARAARELTGTIPIVFGQASDAIESGLVASPAHPEANLTGVANVNDLTPKRLRLLDAIVPPAAKIAYLSDSNLSSYERDLLETQQEAERLKRRLLVLKGGNDSELATAYAKLSAPGVGGLLVGSMRGLRGHPEKLVSLAARHNLPAIYFNRVFVDGGGLMSYGASFAEIYRLVGIYTGRILNGAQPADLPVLNPHAVELVVNMKTAQVQGVVIPPNILAEATEVLR